MIKVSISKKAKDKYGDILKLDNLNKKYRKNPIRLLRH